MNLNNRKLAALMAAFAVLIFAASALASTYIGNANSKKFHYSGCSSVARMREYNKVPLSSRDEAIARGFVPCKRCNP